MDSQQSINIQVKKGLKVHVKEVDQLEGDRQMVADTPPGLKIAVRQTQPRDVGSAVNKMTMCG